MSCKTIAQDIDAAITASSVALTDRFVFTQNGTAYGVSFSGMIASMGVTGTITSLGTSPTATAILTTPSAGDNKIKTIEGSRGVITAVDAYGGISVKTDFAQVGSGSRIIKDVTANQTEFRAIKAGQGIIIEQNTNDVTISATDVTSSSNTVIVNDIDDFPAAVSGVITLADDTDYFITANLATANRFYCSGSSVIRSSDRLVTTLAYTGSDAMFTVANGNLAVKDIAIACVNGSLIDTTGSASGSFRFIDSSVSADTLGHYEGLTFFSMRSVSIANLVSGGLTFNGSDLQCLMDTVLVGNIESGTLFDLSNATFQRLGLQSITVSNSDSGTLFLDGLVSSGNIQSGSIAFVNGVTLSGDISSLNNISSDDVRYSFSDCNTIANSRPDALYRLSAPATTAITTISVPVKMDGTFSTIRSSQITVSADGKFTYNGSNGVTLPIIISVGVEPATGGAQALGVVLYKNGVIVADSKVTNSSSSSAPENSTLLWQDSLIKDDYFEIYVVNDSGTTNVKVNSCRVLVN